MIPDWFEHLNTNKKTKKVIHDLKLIHEKMDIIRPKISSYSREEIYAMLSLEKLVNSMAQQLCDLLGKNKMPTYLEERNQRPYSDIAWDLIEMVYHREGYSFALDVMENVKFPKQDVQEFKERFKDDLE